jgi:hypothetical protein
MGYDEREQFATNVVRQAFALARRTLGARLGLKEADRRRLRITTIGAVDVTGEQRAAVRAACKVAAERERRRAKGAKSRAEYETGSASARQPFTKARGGRHCPAFLFVVAGQEP